MENMKKLTLSIEDELFKRRETGMPHISYASEKIRHKIIQDGRVDLMEEELLTKPDGTTGILAKNELRHWKNLLIVSIITFSRFAMDGGLDEETSHTMCDLYIRRAEEIASGKEGYELYKRAYFDFTIAVHNQKKKKYSFYINNAIHYIQIHLHEQLSLQQIADAVKISKSYLCRTFKAETGVLLSDYIQQKRVEEAIYLMTHTDMTIATISEYLHFSTQSYFISVFKKYYGVTPGLYRKLYHE